jgi:hypothetical protein
MGYNYYVISSVRGSSFSELPELSDCEFDYEKHGFVENPFTYKKMAKTVRASFCRDLLCSHLNVICTGLLRESDRNNIVGIRCFGSVYNHTARYLLENPESIETVEKFFRKVFGVNMHLEATIYDGEYGSKFPTLTSFKYIDKDGKVVEEDLRAYITVYFPSWENSGFKFTTPFFSWVLEFFREMFLVERLAEKEINDLHELIAGYVLLSVQRFGSKDTNYRQYGIHIDSLGDICTIKEFEDSMKNILSNVLNSEGSDFFSMLLTSIFLLGFSKNLDDMNVSGGPLCAVTGMDNSTAIELMKEYKKIIEESALIKCSRKLWPSSYQNSKTSVGSMYREFIRE